MKNKKTPDQNATAAYNRENMAVNPEESTATARWANEQEINHYAYDPKKNIWVGTYGKEDEFTHSKKKIGYEDDRHMITIAGSRAGKGRSSITPVLLEYPESVFVLDPKGENASVTALRRGKGSDFVYGMQQKVAVLDPFGVSDIPDEYRACFNPLEWFPKDGDRAIYEASTLAESFITSDNKGQDNHWDESARAVIQALILHVISYPYIKNETRDLPLFRRLLMEGDTSSKANRIRTINKKIIELESPDDPEEIDSEAQEEQLEALNEELEKAQKKHPFDYLLSNMRKNESYEGFIRQWGSSFSMIPPNERGSILSTARRHTAFLDGKSMASTLQGQSSFDLAELRNAQNGFSLYLCLPARYLSTHGRWLRALLSQTLNTFERMGTAPHGERRVLFVLDECASLGYMPLLEKAAGLIAGYGVKLWFVFQDLSQLQRNYRESWETFIGNAGMLQAFGVTDKTTTEYLSARLGRIELKRTVVTTSQGISTSESQSSGTGSNIGGTEGFAPGTKNEDGRFVETGISRGESENKGTTEGISSSESTSKALNFTQANLMNADEIAAFFARETGYQLIMIQGQRPMALTRENYDEEKYFLGKFRHVDFDLLAVKTYKKELKEKINQRICSTIREGIKASNKLIQLNKKEHLYNVLKRFIYIASAGFLVTSVIVGDIWILSPLPVFALSVFIIHKKIKRKKRQWCKTYDSENYQLYKKFIDKFHQYDKFYDHKVLWEENTK